MKPQSSSSGTYKPKTSHMLKFIIGSVVGVFLFLAPIPTADAFNIPLGFAIDWIGDVLSLDGVNIATLLAFIFIVISCLGTLLAYTVKPAFIMDNEKLKDIFDTHPVYAVSRFIALVLVSMVYFNFGPSFVTHGETGGLMLHELVTGLISIFLVLALAIPILTDFGLMEFIGTLIQRFIRFLFTLPGRAAIDLAASWFGSSAVSVIITRGQHEKGFYTGREAAAICVNFSFVSLPFSFVVARTLGLQGHFFAWYLIICFTCIILAIITPRIWPLSKITDTYLEDVGKQIDEDTTIGKSRVQKAFATASERAGRTTVKDFAAGSIKCYLDVFMDLIPVIMAWGTIALIINEFTPVFDVISMPMRWFLEILQVQGAADYASTTLVGFIDMFIPALILGNQTYIETRFILGALSIVQIIYMAETGILILKSKIPLGIGKLFLVFMIRTLLALPILVFLTRMFISL